MSSPECSRYFSSAPAERPLSCRGWLADAAHSPAGQPKCPAQTPEFTPDRVFHGPSPCSLVARKPAGPRNRSRGIISRSLKCQHLAPYILAWNSPRPAHNLYVKATGQSNRTRPSQVARAGPDPLPPTPPRFSCKRMKNQRLTPKIHLFARFGLRAVFQGFYL